MSKRTKRESKTAGLPPGTLIHVGEPRTEKVRVSVIDYTEADFSEKQVESVEECFPYGDKPSVTWINVNGIHNVGLIETLGTHFGLHPLLMEDIVNTAQRPKVEDYERYAFAVLKMLYFDGDTGQVGAEQVSLVVGENLVISFQERPGDVFDVIRDRLRNAKGRIRKMGADYLAYSLLDAIVDNYFVILEGLGERIEQLEDQIVGQPMQETSRRIQRMKREVFFLRKSVWPLREVVGALSRNESRLFQESTLPYLRDVYDHIIQVVDTVEAFRDMVLGMRDTYMSAVSNKMNEVMQVLTIIATIFIPLTFIAGIYGMNFDIPELKWRWGYPATLAVMAVVAVVMLLYFKRKKWL